MINLSALAVRERSLTLFLMLLVAVGGIMAFSQIGRAEDPKVTINTMLVTAVWPGATAEEMTTQVADKLEKRVQELQWFDHVETFNRPGVTTMQVTLRDSAPPNVAADEWYQVRKKLTDERSNLPAGVVALTFNDEFADVYFGLFALQAPGLPERELVQRAEAIRERYLAVPGVQKVDIIGEQKQRFYINISYQRLAALGLSPQAMFEALARANTITPGGAIETDADRVYIRTSNDLQTEAQIAATPITAAGRTITVGDVATVTRGYEDPPSYLARFNGAPAIMIGVSMAPSFNGSTLGENLHKATTAISDELPLGMTLTQTSDQANAIAHANNEFMLKFVVALITVMIVSFIALGFRTGLIVAAAVPLTLAITFALMLMTGKNFDRITTGALILALGLLVDDAIIAIEIMIVKMEEGMDRIKAASFAWTSTAAPMLSGTLVTIAGFLPVGFAASRSGEYAGNIFWVLAFALLASWFVAVVFTPYLGVLLFPKRNMGDGVPEKDHNAIYATPRYQRLRRWITWGVDNRKLVLLSTLAAFILSVVALNLIVTKQFFPSSDRPETLVEVYMPEGSSISATTAMVRQLEAVIKDAPEAMFYSSYIGGGSPRFFLSANPEQRNPAFAKIVIQTKDEKARDALKRHIDAAVRDGAAPAARVRTTQLLLGPPVPFPVSFRVTGPDVDGVRRIANEVLTVAQAEPLARNMHLEWGNQAKVVGLEIDRARLSQLGLTEQDVSRQIAFLLDGAPITQVRENNRTVDVVARATDAQRGDLDSLANLTVTNARGQSIPLSQIASIEPSFEEPLIKRYNRNYAMTVRGDTSTGVQPDTATNAILDQLKNIEAKLPSGYAIAIAGTPEQSAKSNIALRAMAPITLIIMLTIIMIQVRSFPALVITVLTGPLGMIGAVLSLVVFRAPFGFTAILGLLGLFGILMRNTLILIGQIHHNEAAGRPLYHAIIEATVQRARPVVLTALAGMLAFSPLTLTALWGPMAITLIGGFGIGTILTLFFMPALYALWFRAQRPTSTGELGTESV